jgi:hypothetical protein
MFFDPETLITSTLAHVIGSKTKEALDSTFGEHIPSIHSLLSAQSILLSRILEELSEDDNLQLTEPLVLFPSPQYYLIGQYHRNHMIALFPSGCSINYRVQGMTTITRNITNGGWYLLDLPPQTELYATTTSFACLLKWSDFPLGTAI